MPAPRYKLWIDGVGCWNLVFAEQWTIGGPGSQADMMLLAPLDTEAGRITVTDDEYEIAASNSSRRLHQEDSLEWDPGVALRFRRPHPWTKAATLQPASSHRPVDHADGLILGAGPCVFGAEADCHVVCPDWSHGVVLFERDGTLHWKRFDGPQDENSVNRLAKDALIETDDVRINVEQFS